MKTLLLRLCALLLSAAAAVDSIGQTIIEPGPGRFFMTPFGNDAWSGRMIAPNADKTDGPVASLAGGLKAMRAQRIKSTLYVRGGTYYMTEPLVLGPDDSGYRFTAYPGEKPIISGGRPLVGWQKAAGNLWSVPVPDARGNRWNFSQLRIGNEVQTRARVPNFDPANPFAGGWLFAAGDDKRVGQFGAAISKFYHTNDTITWTFNSPTSGVYKVAFFYSAYNRPGTVLDNRMVVQAGVGQPVEVKNLVDTKAPTAFLWSHVGNLHFEEGQQFMRLVTTNGAPINFSLDAIVLCNDPAWVPTPTQLPRVAAGRQSIVIQAEAFSGAACKEMAIPPTAVAAYPDRFQFRQGDLKAYPRSKAIEVMAFPDTGIASTELHLRTVDFNSRTINVERNSNALLPMRGGNRYYLSGVLEELDSPGEWFLDSAQGVLYYWPKSPTFHQQEAVAPVLDYLIELKGDAAKNLFVSQVQIDGFTFMDTAYSRAVQIVAPTDAAIRLNATRACVIENNRFLNLGGNAIRLENKSGLNEIMGNEIAFCGQGGVALIGSAANQPFQNNIEGNWIHHIGLIFKHSPGVLCDSAANTRIAHNLFEALPRTAICIRSRDAANYSHNTVVEHNDIRYACVETPDTGAIEVIGRHKKDTSTLIQYNRIQDVIGMTTTADGKIVSPANAWGINLGDAASGVVVRGNVIARNESGAIHIDGGKNNTIENNILLEGVNQLISIDMVDAYAVNNRIVRNIFVCTTPKTQLYQVTGTWRGQFFGECNNNLYWHTSGAGYLNDRAVTPYGPLPKWRAAQLDANSLVADPQLGGTVESGLQPGVNSPATQLGFQALPWPKLGLQGSERGWKKQK